MKNSACVLSLSIAICTSAHAVITSDAPGTHAVSQMAETFGVNLDGVAFIGGIIPEEGLPRGFCGGALITDRHVVTAAHCFDTNGDLILDPDLFVFPSEVLFEVGGDWIVVDYDPAKVKWAWEEHGSDIVVAILEEDAPRNIPRYALYGGRAEVGQPFVVVGYGWAGFGPTGHDSGFDTVRTKRTGLNRFDTLATRDGAQFLMADFDSGQPEHNSLGDLGFGPDEVGTTQMDSGSPGFLDGAVAGVVAFGGELALVDATDKADDSWGEREYRTRISNVQDFIMAATDGQAVFVVPRDPAILGDFDDDQLLTAGDIDVLSRTIRLGIHHAIFDLNGDDDVNQLDREVWTQELAGTFFGDADLNRAVQFADLSALSEGFGNAGGWAKGDFDGDGIVQFPDFVLLADNLGKSALHESLAEVPEPSGCWLAIIVGLVLMRGLRSMASE